MDALRSVTNTSLRMRAAPTCRLLVRKLASPDAFSGNALVYGHMLRAVEIIKWSKTIPFN